MNIGNLIRNARVFLIQGEFVDCGSAFSCQDHEAQLLVAPAATQAETWGLVSPAPGYDAFLSHRLQHADLFRLGHAKRVVPQSALHLAVKERCDEFRTRTGMDPEPSVRRQFKDEIHAQLLAQALIDTKFYTAHIDHKRKLFVVHNASRKVADKFVVLMREIYAGARLIELERKAEDIQTPLRAAVLHPEYWAKQQGRFDGDVATSAEDTRLKMVGIDDDFALENVSGHVDSVAVQFNDNDRVATHVTIDDKLVLRKIQIDSILREEALNSIDGADDNEAAAFDANLLLAVENVGLIVDRIKPLFGVEESEE